MTADILKTVLECLKLAPRYLVALGIASAVALYGPTEFLKKIGVLKFAEDYRPWLGATFVLTFSLFGVSVAIDAFGWVQRKRKIARLQKRTLERLNSLTEEEKQILRYYVAKQTKTSCLRIEDSTVQGLKAAGVIYQSGRTGTLLGGFPHDISDFAWNYLNEHGELLEGTTNTYRHDEIKW